jgi:hypothetical protein
MENEKDQELKKENETEEEVAKVEESSNMKEIKEVKGRKQSVKKILKFVVLFVVFLAAWLAVVQYMTADKYEVVVKVVEEGGKIGVNPLTERLDFGDLPKGNSATRFVTIENNGRTDIYVKIVITGNVSDLVNINKNNFVLSPGSSEKIDFAMSMPISADQEEYKGKVTIFKLPKLF